MFDKSLIELTERRLSPILEKLESASRNVPAGGDTKAPDVEAMIRESLGGASTPDPDFIPEEVLIGGDDFLPVNYLRIGLARSRAIARIRLTEGEEVKGNGTGFLVSPRLMITNHHVIGDPVQASNSLVEFNFEASLDGAAMPAQRFALQPEVFFLTSPREQLDYTLIAIRPESEVGVRASSFGYIPMPGKVEKVVKGQSLSIIQHPNGERKKIALRENYVVEVLEDFLIYKTDTLSGSSGAPVFDDDWQLVALHHSGMPERDEQGRVLAVNGAPWVSWMGEHKVKWKGNEGIRFSSIVADLKRRMPELKAPQRMLIAEALQTSDPALRSGPAPIDRKIPELSAEKLEKPAGRLLIRRRQNTRSGRPNRLRRRRTLRSRKNGLNNVRFEVKA